ncbi:DUF1642 domain-containing protein [Lactococcus garvieae]|uniref:DUF1642 domain-containing protein n=1 Tax=Lactococcus garvieae TaxID=1363 RepID=UPI0030CCDAF3
MKKFEEEFNYLIELSGKVLTGQIEVEKFETHRTIFLNEYGQKQQPEIPEVPQFVADWYEENKGSLDYMIFETCRDLTDEPTDEFETWFGNDKNKSITTLVNMKNGYTIEKSKPEIPESLAKVIESHDLSVLGDWEKVVKLLSKEDLTWLSQMENTSASLGKAWTLCNLKTNGYTVSKEKRFYLKNKLTGLYLYENDEGFSECENGSVRWAMFKTEFTQQEIDSMETGSYEQIEVGE